MILVTGGTGFIGQHVIRQLKLAGHDVRILLRPSITSPKIPTGLAIEAAISSLLDERSIRSAMKGVRTILHLAGTERMSSKSDLLNVDVAGTRTLVKAAEDSGIEKFIYLSHLGANFSSAYPVFKAKGLAEVEISQSGLNYTILRSAVAYGPGDQFINPLVKLLKLSPGVFLAPEGGMGRLQPVWVNDLAACLAWLVEDDRYDRRTLSVGGGEYFSFKEIVSFLCSTIGIRRRIISLNPVRLRSLAVFVENTFPKFPVSIFWLDYLATDRTCDIDSMPRLFGILPARFTHQISSMFHDNEIL